MLNQCRFHTTDHASVLTSHINTWAATSRAAHPWAHSTPVTNGAANWMWQRIAAHLPRSDSCPITIHKSIWHVVLDWITKQCSDKKKDLLDPLFPVSHAASQSCWRTEVVQPSNRRCCLPSRVQPGFPTSLQLTFINKLLTFGWNMKTHASHLHQSLSLFHAFSTCSYAEEY